MTKTKKMMIRTLKIPHIDSAKDEIIIFIYKFLEIILNGLKTLNIFRILRSASTNISISAVKTMKKSSFDQLSLRYAASPKISPREMIFRRHYKMKMQLKEISNI